MYPGSCKDSVFMTVYIFYMYIIDCLHVEQGVTSNADHTDHTTNVPFRAPKSATPFSLHSSFSPSSLHPSSLSPPSLSPSPLQEHYLPTSSLHSLRRPFLPPQQCGHFLFMIRVRQIRRCLAVAVTNPAQHPWFHLPGQQQQTGLFPPTPRRHVQRGKVQWTSPFCQQSV